MLHVIIAIIVIFVSWGTFAKCWTRYELRPTYCIKLKNISSELNKGKCISKIEIESLIIPRFDLQKLEDVLYLKNNQKKLAVQSSMNFCEKKGTFSDKLFIMQKLCNDKIGMGNVDYPYILMWQDEMKTNLGHIGDSISVKCK